MIELTALLLSYNEKENIERTLRALNWVPLVLLIDSGSSDDTVALAARAHSNVRVVERPFDSFAGQCNFGLTQIETEWVLSLDADYVLTDELAGEIGRLDPSANVTGYSARFHYCVWGRRLRSTIYPPRAVLYRREQAHYIDEGHGHRVQLAGRVWPLSGYIDHDDRKPLSRWLRSQDRYTQIEARHLLAQPAESLTAQDQLRRQVYFAPAVMFLYLLFGRGLIFDGWQGWYYVMQRTLAEMLLSLRLITERERLEREPPAA